MLPLDIDKTKKVVLIGTNCAQRFCVLGLGGSSGAQAVYETTPLKGLEAKLAGKADLAYLPLTGDSEFQSIPNECWVGKDGRNGVTAVYRKQGSRNVSSRSSISPGSTHRPSREKSSPDTCMLPSKVSSKLPLPETIPCA